MKLTIMRNQIHRILALFLVAFVPRLLISLWSLSSFTFNAYLETWHDYRGYYLWWVSNIAQGLLPYRDFAYTYPPAFVYVLYAFSKIGMTQLPIILGDSGASALVYLIVQKRSSERTAIISSLVYAISPFFLIYEGYSMMSEEPMFFFMLLSLYLIQRDKILLSSIVFGGSVLFKQEALLIVPAILGWCLVKKRTAIVPFLSGFVATFGIASVPFLILSPLQYIAEITLGTAVPIKAKLLLPLTGYAPSSHTICNLQTSTTISNSIVQICNSSGYLQSMTYATITPLSTILKLFTMFLPIVLLIPILSTRKQNNTIYFWCSIAMFLMLVILMDFNQLTHYRYYFVPVYGILLASSVETLDALSTASFMMLSLVLPPSGTFQTLVPVVAVLALFFLWRFRDGKAKHTSVMLSSPNIL